MEGERRTTAGRLADLARRVERADESPGEGSVREWVELVLDEGSFTRIDALRGEADVVAGHGTIDGRVVCLYGRGGGQVSDTGGGTIVKILDHAMTVGAPLIALHDGRGPRLDQGTAPLARYGEIVRRMTHASGVIPQISVIIGPVTSTDTHLVALADFVIMVDGTCLALNDLDTHATISGEDVGPGDLGSAVHADTSGLVHGVAEDQQDARDQVRRLLSFLPANNLEDPPAADHDSADANVTDRDRELDLLVPDSPYEAYDIRTVVTTVLDDGDLCDVAERFAPNIVCGFGRLDGRSVGVVANQPLHLAGCLDGDAARKAARFIRTCDAFNVPVITFVDTPGFLPSMEQERHGLIGHTAKLAFAYAEATVPLLTVTTRAAYGGSYVTMASRSLGADVAVAWPTARIAVADAEAATAQQAEEPSTTDESETRRAEMITTYRDNVETPYAAAERGDLDAVIPPHRTRLALREALRLTANKRATLPPKKHGNLPL